MALFAAIAVYGFWLSVRGDLTFNPSANARSRIASRSLLDSRMFSPPVLAERGLRVSAVARSFALATLGRPVATLDGHPLREEGSRWVGALRQPPSVSNRAAIRI